MSHVPSEPAPGAADIRQRLLGTDAAARSVGERAVSPRGSSGLIPRPNLQRPNSRTPLPRELAAPLDELATLRTENAELRALLEQAVTGPSPHDQFQAELDARDRQLQSLREQLQLFQAGDHGAILNQLQDRDAALASLTEQVQTLELHLRYAQEGGHEGEYVEAIRERDELIESLQDRVAELEAQIASIPPPVPTDEELAKLADELERERCQITRIKKELEDEKRQHAEDEVDFERQMREMEVQLSKERAEMARQRTELNRLQAEVQSEIEAIQRGDGVLRERLANLQQRRGTESPAPPASGPHSGSMPRPTKDSGFVKRLFGKQ
jgi:chromosome segregation ATPase